MLNSRNTTGFTVFLFLYKYIYYIVHNINIVNCKKIGMTLVNKTYAFNISVKRNVGMIYTSDVTLARVYVMSW